MKTTIEFPDDLYRQVKSKAALEGRTIRELTIDLYERWLSAEPVEEEQLSATRWLDEWLRLGNELLGDAGPGPTASEILDRDRDRLERR